MKMKNTRISISNTRKQLWQTSSWYNAVSLIERITSRQALIDNTSFSDVRNAEIAAQRLRSWKAQKPFDQGTFFLDRLAVDAINEEDLFSLLAEPIEAVQARTVPIPDWLEALAEAFENSDVSDEVALLLQQEATKSPLAAYLMALRPLLERGFDHVRSGIQELSWQYSSLPFDPQQITQTLFAELPRQLLVQSSKAFVLEMHVARIQGNLRGETPEERFEDFVRQVNQEERILSLLEEYPVLARQLVLTIDHWMNYTLEFLGHLCADWDTIRATFASGCDPGLLIAVSAGAGDLHRCGRSVLILKFSSGLQLLYKPKSLAIDMHFQELLIWLNERGAKPSFRTLKLIDRGSYGWSEFVHAHDCASSDEVVRFYERQGSYLALLYAFNAVDFHFENIIAAGEHPMLIDLEALFQPEVDRDRAIGQSVWRVGLLPCRLWSNEQAMGIDVSGLGGQEGQLTPRPVSLWEEIGTDQTRLVRQRVEIPARQNRPKLNNYDVDVLDYRSDIIAGFTRMYWLLQERRHELIKEFLPRFAHDEIRLLMRPTIIYTHLLDEGSHPDLLRDALERDRFFDRLWIGIEQQSALARIIPAERRSLLRGDVPLFTMRPNDRAISTDEGEPLLDFFDKPSLEVVKQRLQRLDERDLSRQVWIIEASLATLLIGSERQTRNTLQTRPALRPVSHEQLMTSAHAVGERLSDLTLRNDYGVSWLGLNLTHKNTWSLLPTGTDLYSGTSGIALFLGYLGTITGEVRYTSLAKLALASVRSQLEQQKRSPLSLNIGVFNGLGAPIYLFAHLGALWREPALFQEAEVLVKLLPVLIKRDERLDIIAGSAGVLLSLLSLYEVYPSSRILTVAIQCGDHLLSTAQAMKEGMGWSTIGQKMPLGGFSHGTAGIALSLLKLADVSGEERFRQTAMAALAYDRSLFSPEQQNWVDLRLPLASDTSQTSQTVTEKSQSCMVAWCNGAPGIGLSRLAILKYVNDQIIREEIDISLKTTIAGGLSWNHALCHGALGNLDTVLTATQILPAPRYHEVLECMTAMILESINDNGWVTGAPLGIETPGLMTGLAGIGYELLRLAAPEKVPSVLLIEPPFSSPAIP